MTMRLPFLLSALTLVVSPALAGTRLVPGASIDFNSPSLWDKAVTVRLDDEGLETGDRRWYSPLADPGAKILKHVGSREVSGYLQMSNVGELHRSVPVLAADLSESAEGPEANKGEPVPETGFYVDTVVTLAEHDGLALPRVGNERDKLTCWIYRAPDGSATNFVITAGAYALDVDEASGEVSRSLQTTNYVTSAAISADGAFRLTVKALPDAFHEDYPGLMGFEVFVDGVQVTSADGAVSVFPSRVDPEASDFASRIYSCGFTGRTTAEMINFTKADPIADPSYDVEDLSMLRETALITVSGYPVSAQGLRDFPMLVRVSESRIPGFWYSRAASNGSDVRFTDANGALLPCEVERWNPQGESLVWVKVPLFCNGITVRMHWSLRPGGILPGNNPRKVWSDYLAVWHLGDAAGGRAKDSTGNGHTATAADGVVMTDGVVGLAASLTTDSLLSGNIFASGDFTFTGWYVANADLGPTASPVFGTQAGGFGWGASQLGNTNLTFSAGGELACSVNVDDLRSAWSQLAMTISGSQLSAYVNGELRNQKFGGVALEDGEMLVAAGGLVGDEIRVSRKARSEEWIRTEYRQVAEPGYCTFGSATAKGTENYWIVEPSLSSSSALASEASSIRIDAGRARYGAAVVSFRQIDGRELGATMPTEAGTYRAVFTVNAALDGSRDGLVKEITFILYDRRTYRDLGGHDRVMLFSSDASEACPVTCQGYYDVDADTNEVWVSEGEPWTDTSRRFVVDGTRHVYYEPGTWQQRKLWEFRQARLGNLFDFSSSPADGTHHLPWGGESMRFGDSERKANASRYAGVLILRNVSAEQQETDPAGAYSPVYSNGIGTVYFDAVNAGNLADGKRNQLKVQICAGPAGGLSPEDDVTLGMWRDVPMDVFAITNGAFSSLTTRTDVAELALNTERGTENSFYRIRAHVDTNAAVRVRIVRVDACGDPEDPDGAGLVLVDNIIVSAPAMGVVLSNFGAPAEADNRAFRGQRAPFDIAFPSADDLGSLRAAVKVDYLLGGPSAAASSFIGALTFKYRWRYLEQRIGEWTELTLVADPSNPSRYISTDPLVGEGEGDIEYSAEAMVNAPYYEYWDYTGGNWIWPDGYSERRGNVVLSGDRTVSPSGIYDASHPSPAMGTDFFVRLREGRSDYEGVRLHVRRTGDPQDAQAPETVIPMELCGNGLWRGLYQVATNGVSNLLYRVEAYNRQAATGCDYQWNTNWLYGTEQKSMPVNDVLTSGDGSQWTKLPCDELTEYLLFRFEDESRSLTMIHADYQDFNSWTDANRPDGDEKGHFVGSSTAVPTSGVARLSKSLSDGFRDYVTASIATNSDWQETFTASNAEWNLNRPFSSATSPKGWLAANGMWVAESYQQTDPSASVALQMRGEGYGSLSMSQSFVPRGLESFSYLARVAQSYDQHPFNYYVGTTNDVYNLDNYTFAVPCVMQRRSVDPDFSGMGTVSAVAHYRDSVGGYEARVERVEENYVQLSLYKWGPDGKSKLMAKSNVRYLYSGMYGTGLDGYYDNFAGLYISCSNTENSVRIVAGLMKEGQRLGSDVKLSGRQFYSICCEDSSADQYRMGTFGTGSMNCPATFALARMSPAAVAWPANPTFPSTWRRCDDGECTGVEAWCAAGADVVEFPGENVLLGVNPADLKKWNTYAERLPGMMFTNNVSGQVVCSFRAKPPRQELVLETSPHLKGAWRAVSTNVVSSYGFVRYSHVVRSAEDLDVRIRTGSERGGQDVVVDDLEARQWRGESYDTAEGPNYNRVYAERVNGAPTNFVFTTAWIAADGAIELSPMRSTVANGATYPVSVRAPLMDGKDGRGLGLGSLSISYRDADEHARLIVQICTNSVVSKSALADLSATYDVWTDVATYDFSQMTESERRSGTLACYIGLHGVTGVMRVLVPRDLIAEAHNPAANPDNDAQYGRVYVTMANAKDSPSLDGASWRGWNLRTTDDPSMWLLKDGSKDDAGAYGLSYALNNSVTDDVRADDTYVDNMPYLQTPLLANSAIGEITFKARKYSAVDAAPSVAVYGLREGATNYEYITSIVVSSDFYKTYSFQAAMSENFRSFRLAVTGVPGVKPDAAGPLPESGNVERVLIDEVVVSETIEARMGFRAVGAFRSQITGNDRVPNVPSRSEQPLCRESWGIQAELYAMRLAERIDRTREPEVYLYWYEGASPWGFEKWRRYANRAKLSKADDADMVYRSSYLKSPDAVITANSAESGTIVQYSLEVVYYMVGQEAPMTNVLTSADWKCPDWYRPVDYNESIGNGESFSAFCILDTVAPGWAWINEVNLFGAYENWDNSDVAHQYVEIAAPVEADLSGWEIRLLEPENASQSVITNVLATFGSRGLSGTKSKNESAKMVFHVVASPKTERDGKLTRQDGSLDGVWTAQNPGSAIGTDGVIEYYQGLGFQLVRGTGVIEHEVVGIGTNLFAGDVYFEGIFDPTNTVNSLNRMTGGAFFYAGDDDAGPGLSLGVVSSRGESSNCWDKVMNETPGRLNAGQTIDPNHPTPQGSSITVYANLGSDHIRQTVGKAVNTNETQVIFIRKGSYEGTNITYTADEWFEIADVTVSEGGPVWSYNPNVHELTVTVGRECSNNVLTVTASAQVEKRLRDLGCDESNPYTPAIVDWLGKRTFLDESVYGISDWPDSGNALYLADVADIRGNVYTNLSLTEMYWLDVCPTISNQCLVTSVSCPQEVYPLAPDMSITNVDVTVMMMFTNRDDVAFSPFGGTAWAPYVIRGLEPGVTSWDYAPSSPWTWSNATFKVTGLLVNGLTSWKNPSNWVPLRFFVFHRNSFDASFQSRIQVPEAHSPRSLGYMTGWGDWFRAHPERKDPVWYRWRLDTRLLPVDVEVLKSENLFEY